MEIRDFNKKDFAAVRKIYEQGIISNTATFSKATPSYRNWDKGHLKTPRLVASSNGEVVGFAILSPSFSKKRICYKGVTELTIYVENFHKGQGGGQSVDERNDRTSEKVWRLDNRKFDFYYQ